MAKKGALNMIIGLAFIIFGMFALGGSILSLSILGDAPVGFTYTHSAGKAPLKIGNLNFIAGMPEYVCGSVGSSARYPDERPECWRVDVSYKGSTHTLIAELPKKLDEYLTVTWKPSAKVNFANGEAYFESPDSWTSTYSFSLAEGNAFSASSEGNPYYVKKGEASDLAVLIQNNIASFDKAHSGVFIRNNHKLLERGESWEKMDFALAKGANRYLIAPDASELGIVETEVQAYAQIDADQTVIIKQSAPITIRYEVVLEVPESGEEMPSLWQRLKAIILGWFS